MDHYLEQQMDKEDRHDLQHELDHIDTLSGAALNRAVVEALGIAPAPWVIFERGGNLLEGYAWSKQDNFVFMRTPDNLDDFEYAMQRGIVPDYVGDMNLAITLPRGYCTIKTDRDMEDRTVWHVRMALSDKTRSFDYDLATAYCRAWLKREILHR